MLGQRHNDRNVTGPSWTPLQMLDRFALLPHRLWMLIEPALNGFENVLMLPSGDPTLLAGSATLLDDTALASIGPVARNGP
jgi:hypothetical protein